MEIISIYLIEASYAIIDAHTPAYPKSELCEEFETLLSPWIKVR